MDQKLERATLLEQYRAFVSILDEKGIHYLHFSDEDLSRLSDADLARQVRISRDLARTPTS
jgi:hypothetical protein